MRKLIAIVNVIAWSGFWAFGYLALTSGDFSDTQVVISALLAAVGLFTGILAYLRLARLAEASGYAKKTNQLDAAARNRAQEKGSI
ncbi:MULTISPECIES: hypothetical protein [Rhodobacterales]|jgi:hypothetical protein|uniref:Uncharacterized protein n=1 Tax=Phaeobacter gallaeciensis TaxID=60890 RepID=A0A1B0ZRX2_9RHOB|nr:MULTISPECIES: hypothetical protein [Phaeobacter]MDF1773298.1 hypothetical protein [Pseudophaeobacter sp. bin_em_oilr2.035]MEC9312138.1 hypothetical protein [Pseudomonadota bacterium]ANP36879.1 hypothetical protein JL2886_01985 [Phaeobacter gallaeciensis]MDE4061003.1 hypothetical protein [Phaeobacter gallaeciensis]MDE4097842.1 hypothetical protein [Phaeobacter gallaeciensis]